MKSLCKVLTAVALTAGVSLGAQAALVLDYTGSAFGYDTINSGGSGSAPVERLTGELTVNLPDNFTGDIFYYFGRLLDGSSYWYGDTPASSWGFTAGSATLASDDVTVNNFHYLMTLDSGQVTGWLLYAESPALSIMSYSGGYEGMFGSPEPGADQVSTRHAPYQHAFSFSQGSWTTTFVPDTPLPEPGTYALIAGGLFLMGSIVHRRKRQTV